MGVAAVVALFGIGMCGFLGYFKFKAAVESAARSRMAVPAASVREGIEAVLALGVPLAGASQTPALLARERSVDAEISEISVLDERGRVVFSTDRARVGLRREPPPPGEGVVGMPLRNSFDLRLGDVEVRYAPASSLEALARMRGRLLEIAAAGWAATMLLAAAGLVVAERRSAPRT